MATGHVSHMLWGGLLMFVALMTQLLYLSPTSRIPSAVIGGIGFGLFVDEIGKFITSDNDYFFKPTFALIYVLLIGIYFGAQGLIKRKPLSPEENLANAIEVLQHVAAGSMTAARRRQAFDFLDRAGEIEMAHEIRRMLEGAPLADAGPSASGQATPGIPGWFSRVSDQPWFSRAVGGLMVLQGLMLIGEFALIALLANNASATGETDTLNKAADSALGLSAVAVIEILTAFVMAGLVFIGLRRIGRDDRLGGYRLFERAVLVSIVVTQLLAFFQSWVLALTGLTVLLPAWVLLRLVIQQEEARRVHGDSDGVHDADTAPAELDAGSRQPIVL